MTTENLIQKVENDFRLNSTRYEPFIRHIRFPKYKNIVRDARLDIDCPLTVLVGENGSNKSSVLRAFYGAPAQKSLGEYWFETKIDTIKENDGRPSCFIYGYFNPIERKIVEVLKTRVKKNKDPDYWEPSRPIVTYGMEPIIEKDNLSEREKQYRTKTRWNAIKKEVIYLDFRHEALSAYDRFFYCTDLVKASSRIKTKKDYIRKYSDKIKRVIEENLQDYVLYKKNKVVENKKLDEKVVKRISHILGKKYSSIRILTHTFYTSEPAKTVILSSQNGSDYSEAFAGSGEFSVVCLVDAINNAKNGALILLDEPEVSIHPFAQTKLLEYLLSQILAKKLQVVLATHSPYFVKSMPPGVLKLLKTNKDGSVSFRNKVQSAEIFHEIGASNRSITVLVEDEAAKIVLDACLRNSGKPKLFNVCFPRRFGKDGILYHSAVTDFTEGAKDVIYYLDGDVKCEWLAFNGTSKHDAEVKEIIHTKLSEIAQGVTLVQSNQADSTKDDRRKEFAKYLQERVFFLPDSHGPEEIIWSILPEEDKENITVEQNNYKEAIREACLNRYRSDDAQSINNYMFHYSTELLNGKCITEFDDELRQIVSNLVDFASKVISKE